MFVYERLKNTFVCEFEHMTSPGFLECVFTFGVFWVKYIHLCRIRFFLSFQLNSLPYFLYELKFFFLNVEVVFSLFHIKLISLVFLQLSHFLLVLVATLSFFISFSRNSLVFLLVLVTTLSFFHGYLKRVKSPLFCSR